jgi:hypothetical protein
MNQALTKSELQDLKIAFDAEAGDAGELSVEQVQGWFD